MCWELQQVGWTSHSKSGLDGKTDDATYTARKYERVYSSHNVAFWREQNRLLSWFKNGFREQRVFWALGSVAEVRVPFPSTGSALPGLNILLVSKEGAPKAFIIACQDVRQRVEGSGGAWKLLAITHQKCSQTIEAYKEFSIVHLVDVQ